MSINYPTSIDTTGTSGTLNVQTAGTALATGHVAAHQAESDAIIALETKVGVDSSAVTSTIDYLLKNAASINPGHKHTVTSVTLSLDDLSDVVITTPVSGNGLTYNGSNWVNSTTSTADASATVKGVTKLSLAAVSPTAPIAVGDNDPRVPTQGENDALVGNNTDVAVGTGNKFITQTGLQHSAENYAADSSGSDAYVATLSPVPTAYTSGMPIRFKAGTANTGAASLNVNSLGAKTIKNANGSDLITGEIIIGQIVEVFYDGTNFVLGSPPASSFYGVTGSGLTTYDISSVSGVQNIAHGLGIIPKMFNVNAFYAAGVLKNSASSLNGNSISFISNNTTGSAQATFTLSGDGTVSNSQSAVITSDATNIILTWTKTGTPTSGTIQINWNAFV